MSLEKLNVPLKEALERLKIEKLLPFQKQILPKIKSGRDLFIVAPEGSGKTTALVISTIQKLDSAAFEDAPRALIFVQDKEAALALEKEFDKFTKYMDLRVYSAYDAPDISKQKDDIYAGVDIVIATPKKLFKLFKITGINVSQLKVLAVENAEFLTKNSDYNDLIRIPQHISRCQYLVFASNMSPKIERLKDSFMARAETLRLKV
ncbi:DEAD/DEAH box helicase [Salegentibacter maritimus]|uniref:DEAD/DEAH box helicase n=1 Tax=Salegentibacter maritimus TaxID=2794347 RepID=A0ABS0TL13_9FLAO|nr:DEAD/DEAH box helicase [Salegentibacter maritimus]MBI6120714.1 DEAD/DEAH box helicase [Salegentibacter maritimus]